MGVTDTKAINTHIDAEFRSIRKYCDKVYGEVTVLESKKTKEMFALVEKIMMDDAG